MGVGALTGSLFLASLKNVKRRGTLLLAISLVWGISIALFSKTTS
jgi:hypothetical protein